jgi:hypothetical protein
MNFLIITIWNELIATFQKKIFSTNTSGKETLYFCGDAKRPGGQKIGPLKVKCDSCNQTDSEKKGYKT